MNFFRSNKNGNRKLFSSILVALSVISFSVGTLPSQVEAHASSTISATTSKKAITLFGSIFGSGTLNAKAEDGKLIGRCPLKDTKVNAKISGYVSRVKVTQTFQNPYKKKIEAVYTFPLSDSGAVDSMVMKVGDRTIIGSIKKREEARKIYERAKSRGHVASLLDQERTNIFTQSVANIEPGKEVQITIEYIDLLPFENGKYSFTFPTVVGPRFIPGKRVSKSGTGRAMDTNQVPDASKITPPVTPKGTRAGHDISINVELDAATPIRNISSKLHQVDIKKTGLDKASISLTSKKTIPNKDFVLSWQVSEDKIESGYLTYRNPKKDDSGYFTLMLLPPKKVATAQIAPKEMVFLIDCSGSQNGKPIAKAKETLHYVIDHMNPQDTFQIVSFNNKFEKLFTVPRASTREMKEKANQYIDSLHAHGGTWMEPAVREVCGMKAPNNRLRIVSFMTDGYVGNDMAIVGLVKELRGKSRWFPFGTGNSVNRFLINGIAAHGGGVAEYVLLNSKPGVVGKKFYDRISSPVLTDVKVKFEGVQVKEVYPKNQSDVWAQRPLYIKGRYLKPGQGSVTLTGFRAGKPYTQKLAVNFPESNATNPGIASVWARAKVDRLMAENWRAAQINRLNKELKDEITDVALKHHILTQFTSFVAVDTSRTTKGGKPIKKVVPVEMPDGVSRKGVFGKTRGRMSAGMIPPSPPARISYNRRGRSGYNFRVSGDNGITLPSARGYGSGGSASQSRSLTKGRLLARSQPYRHGRRSLSNKKMLAGKFYKSKRRVQIIDNKPIIKDFREAKDESSLDKLTGDQKLSAKLKGLTGKTPSRWKAKGLVVRGKKIQVVLYLSKFDIKVQKLLAKAGVLELRTVSISKGSHKVTGFVSLENLKKLIEFDFVKFIKPAK